MTVSDGIAFQRYRALAIGLHWLVALLLLSNIGIAWYFNTLHGLERTAPLQLHKSIGITVLLLSLARLAARLAFPAPKLPSYVTGWERRLAQAVHVLFYVAMIGLPLTGWFMVSASQLIRVYPITLFGFVEWPAIAPLASLPVERMKQAHELFEEAHHLLAKAAYGLIVLHVGGALVHQFVRRDDVLARMVPFLKPRMA